MPTYAQMDIDHLRNHLRQTLTDYPFARDLTVTRQMGRDKWLIRYITGAHQVVLSRGVRFPGCAADLKHELRRLIKEFCP